MTAVSNSSNAAYDELSYPNYVFADTHPGRISANATIFGLITKAPEDSRVLEIGCAGGLNILSHAVSLPSATFIGIDISAEQIGAANELKQNAGISNVTFIHTALEKLDPELGTFDFIICHGVFAWVPDNVRGEILKLCDNFLAPTGVAYISYNTLPGWHLHNILRDAMLYRSQDAKDPQSKIKLGKEFLEFSRDLFPENAQPVLTPIIDHLLSTPENYLAHDHLGSENNPMYFADFLLQCEQHNLMYLSESDLSTMIPREFPGQIREEVQKIANGSLSRMEQYFDFLRLRPFRKTLICRNDCPLNRAISPTSLVDLSVGVRKTVSNQEYCPKPIESAGDFTEVIESFPRWKTMESILAKVAEDRRADVLTDFFEQVFLDTIEIRADGCGISDCLENDGEISPLVRELAKYGQAVPNLRSETVLLSPSLAAALSVGHKIDTVQRDELRRLGCIRLALQA